MIIFNGVDSAVLCQLLYTVTISLTSVFIFAMAYNLLKPLFINFLKEVDQKKSSCFAKEKAFTEIGCTSHSAVMV